jgi:phage terminase large subunit-like protein
MDRVPTLENAANLAPGFLDSINRKYAGTRRGRQESEAELLEDIEGALWNRDRIDELRRSKAPELEWIVVAVDPAISAGEDSDETGIIVAGIGVAGHGYVLEDASGKYSPSEWANKAVNLYHKYEADPIVAEINQGGQMVEQTIRAVDKNIAYRGIHAKRGKMLRAEPISALYSCLASIRAEPFSPTLARTARNSPLTCETSRSGRTSSRSKAGPTGGARSRMR